MVFICLLCVLYDIDLLCAAKQQDCEVVIEQPKPKKKSRYQESNEAIFDLDGEESLSIQQKKNRSTEAVGNIANRKNNLYQVYIQMFHVYREEYYNAIWKIYEGAKKNRKNQQKMVTRYGTADVDQIPQLCSDIDDYFTGQAVDEQMPQDCRGYRDQAIPKQNAAEMQLFFQSLVKQAVIEALKAEEAELQADDTQAVEDTVTLFAQFLTTQAKNGMDPNPTQLVGFLSSVDFIALAPVVAGCLSSAFNCGPKATRRTQVVCMVAAVLATWALFGLNIAISFGAFDSNSEALDLMSKG